MKKLTVIIVNYNVKEYLRQCLHSVERALQGMEGEVIVVDNASSDGSVEELAAVYPSVTFIANKDNRGFSCANNQAIRLSKAEYVLLLNPDTIVGEDVLHHCISFMDTHPDAGGVGVKMLADDGRMAWESRRGVPTLMTSFYKMMGLCSLFPKSRVFGKYYMRYLDANEVNRIEIMSGAFMMLRRQALEEIGLLDETFFMYGEDIDLSYRLLGTGYNNYYLPRAIVHYKGESTQKTSFRYVRNFYNAMLIFYDKHFDEKKWMSMLVRMGIFLMGGMEFLLRQRNRLKNLLFPKSEQEKCSMLVVGSRQMCEEVEALCKQCQMKCTCIVVSQATLPLKLISEKKKEYFFDFITFDTDLFAYVDILSFMQREHLRKGSRHMRMGLYSVDSKTLVTAMKCLKYEIGK